MLAKAIVAAVLGLAAVAAADALRSDPGARRPAASASAPSLPPIRRATSGEFTAGGAYLRTRVLRNGRDYLSAEAVEDAFPDTGSGLLDIRDVALGDDGTLVLAVLRFPPDRAAVGALEVWRDRRLVRAVIVPSGSFAGGLGFTVDGRIATFDFDGRLAGLFDRHGRRVELGYL